MLPAFQSIIENNAFGWVQIVCHLGAPSPKKKMREFDNLEAKESAARIKAEIGETV